MEMLYIVRCIFCLFVCLFVCQSICSVCLFVCLCLFVCTFVCLFVEPYLRQFCISRAEIVHLSQQAHLNAS